MPIFIFDLRFQFSGVVDGRRKVRKGRGEEVFIAILKSHARTDSIYNTFRLFVCHLFSLSTDNIEKERRGKKVNRKKRKKTKNHKENKTRNSPTDINPFPRYRGFKIPLVRRLFKSKTEIKRVPLEFFFFLFCRCL